MTEMNLRTARLGALVVIGMLVAGVAVCPDGPDSAYAKEIGPRRNPQAPLLPPNLFISQPPGKALAVRAARRVAKPGEPIVLRGRVGGVSSPITRNRAVFLLSDTRLPLCKEGCPTPWDYCCESRETIVASLAMVQISDAQGRPLKVDLTGRNGLKPAAEVVVSGTVLQRTPKVLIVDARNIYVVPAGL